MKYMIVLAMLAAMAASAGTHDGEGGRAGWKNLLTDAERTVILNQIKAAAQAEYAQTGKWTGKNPDAMIDWMADRNIPNGGYPWAISVGRDGATGQSGIHVHEWSVDENGIGVYRSHRMGYGIGGYSTAWKPHSFMGAWRVRTGWEDAPYFVPPPPVGVLPQNSNYTYRSQSH